MPRVVLALYPGCTLTELAPLLSLLEGAAEALVAGPAPTVRTQEGLSIQVDASFEEALGLERAMLAIPGGDPTGALEDAALHALVRESDHVAAICNGVLVAAASGMCADRRITHTVAPPYAQRPEFDELLALGAELFSGATWLDEDVVIDGPLVTAKPWAAIDFAKKAVVHAGLLHRAEAASRARYLRGVRDRSHGDPYLRFAIFLAQVEGRPTTRADVEAHVEHLRALERTGKLELAGPFAEHRSGLVVVRAKDLAEAEAIAAADPFVARGVRTADVRPWQLSCDDDDHLLGP
jgi:uncharacterized protein YciI/putative intracellular protease/amidase